MVTQFRVGQRPNVLTAQNVDEVIAFLPSFGEQTLQNLKAAAPFRSTRQLQDAGLNAKQIIMILVLFNLQPNDDYEGGANDNGNG